MILTINIIINLAEFSLRISSYRAANQFTTNLFLLKYYLGFQNKWSGDNKSTLDNGLSIGDEASTACTSTKTTDSSLDNLLEGATSSQLSR